MTTDPTTALIEAIAQRAAEIVLASMNESAALTPGAPAIRTSPFATITEAAEYLNLTRRSVESHLATGRLTPVKHGMPQNTPRSKWRHWPTRIAWTELEAFARGESTGPLGAAATRARALTGTAA